MTFAEPEGGTEKAGIKPAEGCGLPLDSEAPSPREGARKLAAEAFKERRFQDALVHYTRAMQDEPSDCILPGNRAATHLALRDWEAALRDATLSVEMNAAYVKGWFRVGTALLRMGRFQEATAAFDKALALDPDNHEIEARLNEARAAVHAAEMNEKDERARAALVTGLALLAGGLLDESLKVLEAALDIDSRDQSVKEQLWLAVGDAEAAVSARAKEAKKAADKAARDAAQRKMAAKNRVRQAKQSGAALAVASAAGQLPEEDAPPSSAVGCDESSAAKLGTAASWRRADGGYASTVASAGRDGERSAASPSPSAAEITTGSCGDDGGCPAPPRLSGEQCAPPAAAADSGAGAVAGVSGVDQPTPSSHSEAPRESGGRVLYSLQWAPPTSGEDRLGDTPTIDGQGAVGHLSGSRTAGDGGLQTQQAAAVANHQRKQEEEEGPATVLNQSQLSALLRSMAGAGRHSGDEMTGGVVVSRPHAGSDEGATSGGRWVGGESSATLEGGGQERAEPLRQAVAACNAVGSVARNFAKRAAAAHRQRDYAAALSFLTEAVGQDPTNPVLHCNRSAAAYHLGLFAEALEDASRAVRMAPTRAKSQYRRGTALAALGRFQEAEEAFATGLRLLPESEELRSSLENVGQVLSDLSTGAGGQAVVSSEQELAASTAPVSCSPAEDVDPLSGGGFGGRRTPTPPGGRDSRCSSLTSAESLPSRCSSSASQRAEKCETGEEDPTTARREEFGVQREERCSYGGSAPWSMATTTMAQGGGVGQFDGAAILVAVLDLRKLFEERVGSLEARLTALEARVAPTIPSAEPATVGGGGRGGGNGGGGEKGAHHNRGGGGARGRRRPLPAAAAAAAAAAGDVAAGQGGGQEDRSASSAASGR